MTDKGLVDFLQQHFEAHQRNEDGLSHSAAERAASMMKQISVLTLNDGVSNLSIQQQGSAATPGDTDLTLILLRYVDNAMAVEVTSESRVLVERTLDLVAALAAASSEGTAEAVAARAIEFSTVLLERVRSQACQLMGFMGYHLAGMEYEWANEWFEALRESIMPRFNDKSQSVRNSAIRASAGFFEGGNDSEDLLEMILWSLWHDPSVSNRVAAVGVLPVTKDTIEHIIARVRDIKEKVRHQALEVLITKVDAISDLSEEHFAEIVRCGLNVRCESTKRLTTKLICSRWMKAAKFNPIQMLKLMGVAANEEECEKAISVVLATAREDEFGALDELSDPEIRAFRASVEKNLIQLSDSSVEFDAEEIFFARVACETVQKSDKLGVLQKDEILSKAVPDIPVLCEIFQKHSLHLMTAIQQGDAQSEDEECFICLQLLQLAKVADLQEEGSRRHFSTVMEGMLSCRETPDDIVEGCVESIKAAKENEHEFLETIFNIISTLSGAERGDSNEDECLRQLRILSILSIVLEICSSGISSHDRLKAFIDIVVSAVTNSNPLVREAGVSCFGKLGLFTEESTLLAEFKPILLKVAINEKEKLEIRSQAMLALSDWSLLFSEVLQPCDIEGATVSFLQIVREMMQHENPSVIAIAAEIICKLLFSGRVCESTLIAQLLVIFFDSSHEDIESDNNDIKEVGSFARLQQLLCLFFPAYCIKSEHGQDAMLGSIKCALDLAQAKKKSEKKKAALPLVKMIDYVCSVVDVGREVSVSNNANTPSTDKAMVDEKSMKKSNTALLASIQVAEFLINDGSLTVTQTRSLCKFLGRQEIDVETGEHSHLRKLKDHMEELGMMLTDNTCLRSLTNINEYLVDVKDEDDASVENEDEADAGTHSGDTTLEDSIMESLAAVSISNNKENTRSAKSTKANDSTNRRNSRLSEGSSNILGNVAD